MAIHFRFDKLNPFAVFFRRARSEDYEDASRQRVSNAQGLSQEDTAIQTVGSASVMGVVMGQQPGEATVAVTGIQFEQVFESKRQKVSKYREMSNFAEIEEATENVCDDAIIEDDDGNILNMDISKEIPENTRMLCAGYFKYLINTVMRFHETGWDIFKRWLIDSELYGELILNQKGDNIVGIKLLPSYTMSPIYNGGVIQGYVQVPEKNFQNKKQIDFDKDQIVYINYGKFGDNIGDTRGYYESAIKTYNQLKSMEDAVVVYRLVRSVERRAWNIYTGKMQKTQAEAYIKGLMQRFKKRMIYDANTGAVNSAQNVIAMTEDYWFSTNSEGNGTKVETLAGGANLGELEDVKYFLRKLYKTLKLPKSRWEETTTVSYGKSGEITREEIHFARFIERLQNKFKYFILEPFITLLRLRGIDPRYLKSEYFNLQFTQSNLFKEYKEMEVLDARLAILNQFSSFMYNPTESPAGLFAPEFVLKKYFRMSDADVIANEAAKAKLLAASGGEAGAVPPEGETGPETTPPPEEKPEIELPPPPEEEATPPEETPPTGGEAAPAMEKKKPKPFDVRLNRDVEVFSPKTKTSPDLFTAWRQIDAELLRRKNQ